MSFEWNKKIDDLFGMPTEQSDSREQHSEQLQQIQNSFKSQYLEIERTEEILREYQDRRMRASRGMTDIIIGAECGASLYDLFIRALQVIDDLVDDGGVFVGTVKKNLYKVSEQAIQTAVDNGYSYVNEPQKAELLATEARLKNLKKAQINAVGDAKLRIENVISEHEKKIAELKKIIL